MLQIIILYALFASTFSLGKVLLQYSSPIFLVGIRMSIAGFVLLLYQYFQRETVFEFKWQHWKLYLQIVLCTTYFPYIFRFWGLQYMSSSKASLIYTLGPFLTYGFSYLLNLEKITFKKLIGLSIGFVGLLPVLISPSPKENLMGGLSLFSWAEMLIIASIAVSSYGWIVMHKLLKENNHSPALANGISMFSGGALALATSWVFESQAQPIDNMAHFMGLLAIVILVSNLLCHNMYGALLKQYSPTFLSFASFLTPLFTALYGWLFLHEQISWEFFISAACVMLGLAIFYHDELTQQKKIEESVAL